VNRNVLVLSLTIFFTLITICSWYYLLPLHLKSLGASDEDIGLTYTIFSLGYTIFQGLGGYLADRFGRKQLIALPTFVFPLTYGAMALSNHWMLTAGAYLVGSIASAIQAPAFSALLAESGSQRERAFIWYEAAASFGAAVGPFFGAILLGRLDLHALMGVTAAMTLLSAITRTILLKETKESNRIPGERPQISQMVNRDLRWFFVAGSFFFLATSITMGPFPTLHFKEGLLMPESKINLLFGLAWGIAALLSLFGERITARLRAKRILAASSLLNPLSLLAWVFVGQAGWQIGPFLASFFFAQFIIISYQLLLAELTTPENRGRVAGLFGVVTGLISAAGPMIAMQAKLAWGDWLPFGLATLFGALALAALLPCRPKPKPLDHLPARPESLAADRRR